MRIVALIDKADVIERILRYLGVWEAGVRVESARDPPQTAEPIFEPWLDDLFPDYDHESVLRRTESPSSAEVRHEGLPSIKFPPPVADADPWSGVLVAPLILEKQTVDPNRPI